MYFLKVIQTRIEKVIRKRKVCGKPEVLVRWLGRSLPFTGAWTVEMTEFCNENFRKSSNKELLVYCLASLFIVTTLL